MSKPKTCPVCVILAKDSVFSDYVNSRLKNDAKISEVKNELEDKGYLPPSKYYFEKHNQKCLEDFKVSKLQLPHITNNSIKEEGTNNSLDKIAEVEKYRNMLFQDRKDYHIKLLNEIRHMTIVNIHHQLIYGRTSLKAVVPKEDIGALKQVEDILIALTTNSFDKEEIPEVNVSFQDTSVINEEILNNYNFPDMSKLEKGED